MRALFSRFLDSLWLGIIKALPPGETPDAQALFGLVATQHNLNKYAVRENAVIITAGTASVLAANQAHRSVIRLDAGASGGFTLTLPSTASIIADLGSTVPTDGTFAKIVWIENNSVGQTGTLTAGDANTTITGTATFATAVTRAYLLTVLSATTISYENLGSLTL